MLNMTKLLTNPPGNTVGDTEISIQSEKLQAIMRSLKKETSKTNFGMDLAHLINVSEGSIHDVDYQFTSFLPSNTIMMSGLGTTLGLILWLAAVTIYLVYLTSRLQAIALILLAQPQMVFSLTFQDEIAPVASQAYEITWPTYVQTLGNIMMALACGAYLIRCGMTIWSYTKYLSSPLYRWAQGLFPTATYNEEMEVFMRVGNGKQSEVIFLTIVPWEGMDAKFIRTPKCIHAKVSNGFIVPKLVLTWRGQCTIAVNGHAIEAKLPGVVNITPSTGQRVQKIICAAGMQLNYNLLSRMPGSRAYRAIPATTQNADTASLTHGGMSNFTDHDVTIEIDTIPCSPLLNRNRKLTVDL
jgi:hypothetical protein